MRPSEPSPEELARLREVWAKSFPEMFDPRNPMRANPSYYRQGYLDGVLVTYYCARCGHRGRAHAPDAGACFGFVLHGDPKVPCPCPAYEHPNGPPREDVSIEGDSPEGPSR